MPNLTPDEIMALIPPEAMRKHKEGAFAPKLTENERRAILVLDYKGVHRNVLAAAFGINRRTLASMLNKHSTRYHKTRQAFAEGKPEEWLCLYLTEDIALRVAAAKGAAEVSIVKQKDYDERPRDDYNPRADKYAGNHTVKNKDHTYSHKLVISWDLNTESWAYCDTNGFDTTNYTGWHTSTEAYKQGVASCMDALED